MAIKNTRKGDQIADVSLTRDEVFMLTWAIRFGENRNLLAHMRKGGCLFEQDDFNNLLQKLDESAMKKA